MQIQAHIGLLNFVIKMKLFISIALMLNTFLNKLKNLLEIKHKSKFFSSTSKQFSSVWVLQHRIHDFMLTGKKLTDYISLSSPYDFKENDNVILSYFKNESK